MRRLPSQGGSGSTVSSLEEENIREQPSSFAEPVTQSPFINETLSNFVFNTCNDVRVGENVTHVYMSNLAQGWKF